MVIVAAAKLLTSAVAGMALGAIAAAPAAATTPDRSWIGVRQILILSQVTGQGPAGLSAEMLCERVRALASKGAPAPVSCTALGDPALQSAGSEVLSVQAAVNETVPGHKLLLFTIKRAAEGGLEPAPIYFGATPRAVPLGKDLDPAMLDQALGASLSELLPWLNQSNTNLQPKRKGL